MARTWWIRNVSVAYSFAALDERRSKGGEARKKTFRFVVSGKDRLAARGRSDQSPDGWCDHAGKAARARRRRRRRVRRTSLNCTMKSLVYLITSSELRRLDADSEGACAGRGGELPIDRQGGARKRTKSCREGLRGSARLSATAARRRGRADLERSPCPRAYLRPGSHGEAGEGSRGGPRAPRAEGDGFHRRGLARRALGGGHEKSAESLPAGCELGTEATDERHAGSAIRRRESVAWATRPAVGAHAS